MGGSALRSSDVHDYYVANSHIRHASDAREIFRGNRMNPAFDPSKIKLPREACDSPECPDSRGIIFAEDITGSMSQYLMDLIKNQFPKLIESTHKSVSFDPHIMFMGIGDVACRDDAPLQVTQFEADIRMVEQLQQIWLEEGGGGNGSESYALAWYFAGKHIHMDCLEKRNQKGFLFTFGDDGPTPQISKNEIEYVFGSNSSLKGMCISGEDCLRMAEEKFYCYHINFSDSYSSGYRERLWRDLMGSHAIFLKDHRYVSELVITILRMYEGDSKTEALSKIADDYGRDIVENALIDHEETVDLPKPSGSGSGIDVF